jgi:hypothetical protein
MMRVTIRLEIESVHVTTSITARTMPEMKKLLCMQEGLLDRLEHRLAIDQFQKDMEEAKKQ